MIDTLKRKINDFYEKHFGPITLQQAVYVFCEDPRAIPEFNRRASMVEGVSDGILDELYNLGFVNPIEYGLVLKNMGRKKWDKY